MRCCVSERKERKGERKRKGRGSKQAFLAQHLQEDQIENENDLKTKETTITTNKEKTRRQIYIGSFLATFYPRIPWNQRMCILRFLVPPTQFILRHISKETSKTQAAQEYATANWKLSRTEASNTIIWQRD